MTHVHANHRAFATLRAGEANGMQIAWVDGKEVSKRSGIVFTEDGKNAIEKLMLHNFHGGKSDNFAPGQDQSVWCAARCLHFLSVLRNSCGLFMFGVPPLCSGTPI